MYAAILSNAALDICCMLSAIMSQQIYMYILYSTFSS